MYLTIRQRVNRIFNKQRTHFSGVLYFQQPQFLKSGGAGAALRPANPQLLVFASFETLAADNIYVRPLAHSCVQQMTAVNLCFIQLFVFLSAAANQRFGAVPVFGRREY